MVDICLFRMILFAIAIAHLLHIVQAFTLRVLSNPSSCNGGSICGGQPIVSILNSQGQVAIDFVGTAYVTMGDTPVEDEPLYYGRSCTESGDCGAMVSGATAVVPFTVGVATFSNLVIKSAGSGYTLKIIARNQFLSPFAFVYTSPFDVLIGPPFKMVFTKFLGTVTGGTVFNPSPAVAIADRGNNPITSNIEGSILVELRSRPSKFPNEQLLCQIPDGFEVTLYSGQATFSRLLIKSAGFPYRLGFQAILKGIPRGQIPDLFSKTFTVGIGPVAQLTFEPGATLSAANVYAGEFFRSAPRVYILDAGGNLVDGDFTSAIEVTIYDNPAGAILTPNENRFVVARAGIVTFSSLKLDKRAEGVRLGFSLYSYNSGSGQFAATGVFLPSERFDVLAGLPREIITTIKGDRAWAGGSAFEVQPKVTLIDYGKNVLIDDYSSVITASLVPSPGTATKIRIDTSVSIYNTIKSVTVSVASGTYGVGQVIVFNLNFEFDVWLSKTSAGVAQPYIILKGTDAGGNPLRATLLGSHVRSDTVPFTYSAVAGDSVASLDYASVNAVILPTGCKLYDGIDQVVNITLPSISVAASKIINIDTNAPRIIALTTTAANGEYGVGDLLDFFVTFDMPVIVVGVPYLKFNTTAAVGTPGQAGFRPAKSGAPGLGVYKSASSDFKTLKFSYVVGPGDNSAPLGFNGTFILKSFNTSPVASIKRYSNNPVTDAILGFYTLVEGFHAAKQIVIDTSAPILDTNYGIKTNHSNGLFASGEVIFVSIKFNKPVINSGLQIILKFNCGLEPGQVGTTELSDGRALYAYASFSQILTDSMTIIFRLDAPSRSTTPDLDISRDGYALEISGSSTTLRRKTTTPTTPCDLSTAAVTASGNSLRDNSNIALRGFPPAVSGIVLISASSSSPVIQTNPFGQSIYEPDSFFIIDVQFSMSVAITCSPVLVIMTGAVGITEEAVYQSGNRTNTLKFKYTVRSGNVNPGGLFYRFTPNALCSTSGCPIPGTAAIGNCGVFAFASKLVEPADLLLPRNTGVRQTGVPLDTSVEIVPKSTSRGTSISRIYSTNAAGTYGSGSLITFIVEFNDDVRMSVIANSKMPQLLLNIGKFANYAGGFQTNKLSFVYVATSNDTITELKPIDMPGTSIQTNDAGPLKCRLTGGDNCEIINLNNDVVSLNALAGVIQSTGVRLDSAIPYITRVYTTKGTSPYDGEYSVGEVMDILVEFSRPVIVTGPTPQIFMDVNPGYTRPAFYIGIDNTYKTLTFRYTIIEGDNTANLMYLPGSIYTTGGLTKIMFRSELPLVQVDYRLPGPAVQTNLTSFAGYVGDNWQYIKINTNDRPKVVDVSAITPAQKRYAVGDVVKIEVKFNRFVISTGRSFLNMNCGKRICVASYIGWDRTNLPVAPAVPTIPSPPTKTFYYAYTVQDEDFNSDFDYIDQFSYFPGVNDNGGAAFIYIASTQPSAVANRDLPSPGTRGSLGFNSQILIDGFAAYMTSIEHIAAAGTYGTGSLFYLRLNFSVPVTVVGSPYIVMETGDYDRPAPYHHGSGTSSLFFRYIAQPGDVTVQLDYASDRALLLSSSSSFKYNGGNIYTYSQSPSQVVKINLNTPGGEIAGTKNIVASQGVYSFLDLSIRQRGPDFNIEFSVAPNGAGRTLHTTSPVFVSFSNEVEARPFQSQPFDMNGYDLKINNNLAVIGCPNCNVSVTTIQTVTATGKRAAPEMQVQIVKLKIKPQPMILSFHTSAAVGETVQGFFSITYANFGTTRLMPVNIDGPMMTSILKYDLVRFGVVSVTREPYIYCACDNAFVWTLTFNDLDQGSYPIITLNADQVGGKDGTVGDLTVLQYAADIKGSFTMSAYGKTTRDIPYDATAKLIQTVLPDIELSAEIWNIQTTSTEKDGTRSWLITFNAHVDSYDIPLLVCDGSKLTGGSTSVFSKILRPGIHGPRGLAGTFQLEWRGNKTVDLPVDATAAQMKAALEALDIINYVNVWRSNTHVMNGYVWTIEFVDYNYRNARNYYRSDIDNVERIIPHSKLIGTEAQVVIGAIYDIAKPINTFGAERKGSYGDKAGSFYVFQNTGESWDQVATVIGSNTDENDKFGTSVSIVNDLIIVGAVGADKTGYKEKQNIQCKASSGSFKLRFRGWETDWIPYDVKRDALIFAIVSEGSVFSQLYGVNGITIDNWGTAQNPDPGLCTDTGLGNGYIAVITFLAPVDGAAHLNNGVDTGSNIELVTLDTGSLVGVATVSPNQEGTWKPHGVTSDVQQSGAAYVFRDSTVCNLGSTVCLKKNWREEAIFYPNNPVGTEKFGTSVAICSTHAVVGAPGARSETGSAYIYAYDIPSGKWSYSQELIIPELGPGDSFATTVDIQSRTVIVGAPNSWNGKGAVYIFRRPVGLVYFSVAQTVLPPLLLNPLFPSDFFGYSVALDNDQLVCGAPGMDDRTVYLGRSLNIKDTDTGGAYVFQRVNEDIDFVFFNKLVPSNVKRGDRFGFDVAISGSTIAVSALENFGGNLTASKAIIEIVTDATYNAAPLGSVFRLKWKKSLTAGERTTRELRYDITASDMQVALQQDLDTGKIIVSRDFQDRYNGGYSWRVTFTAQDFDVPLFVAEYSKLVGTKANVIVRYVNKAPSRLRGNGHIFQQSSRSSNFVEQLLIAPFSYQPSDRCGQSISVSGDFAFLGCPNRDTAISNQNAGSGFIFSLSLLHIKFASYTYSVQEGNTLPISIIREGGPYNQDIAFYVQTVNRNDVALKQSYIRDLFGINADDVQFPSTFIDYSGIAGSACGRTQDYGSTHYESPWVDGMYDYRGISDYVQLYVPKPFLNTYTQVDTEIVTNADTIFEYPNENFTVAIHSPGLWPSVLGRLYTTVDILDDSDGIVSGKSYYDKLYQAPFLSGTGVGKAVSVSGPLKLMALGSPLTPSSNGRVEAGAVIIYSNWVALGATNNGWSQFGPFITSPSSSANHFGEDVALSYVSTRNVVLLAVTEPSTFLVHTYVAPVSPGSLQTGAFVLEASLSIADSGLSYFSHYMFGSRGTLALNGQLLAIGIPGFETVYVFVRRYDAATSAWKWFQEIRLRSSEYDYDNLYTRITLHNQYFGYAVSISDRTIVVGSPHADYGKLGSYLVEQNWDTQGETVQDYSKGKVYSFFSAPGVQVITLNAIGQLARGEFKLSMTKDGGRETTTAIRFTTDATLMEVAIEALSNVDDVSVTVASGPVPTGYYYSWTVTFHSEWTDIPLLEPTWGNVNNLNGQICSTCATFDFPWTPPDRQLEVTRLVTKKDLIETHVLQNPFPKSGDRFGAAVSLDGDQVVVGAPGSGSLVTTTWDFEAGTLVGWSKSGTAFDYQPTYGDNSYFRNLVGLTPGRTSVSSRRRGLYSIATFDMRPGDTNDYSLPDSRYPQGNIQGNRPIGTLTSEVFIVNGNRVDFLIGGDCDLKQLYVVLLVDGLPMDKVASSSCTDAMHPTNFNLTLYRGRAAQIRIVDNSPDGHINVDDFVFDWGVLGSTFVQGNKMGSHTMTSDSQKSGAAYMFLRQRVPDSNGVTNYMCAFDKTICRWNFETILLASDKRPGSLFGSSVSLNNEAGVVAIGAPGAAYTGFYKEVPSVYPFMNASDYTTAAGLTLPVGMSSMEWFQSEKTAKPLPNSAHGIWYLRDRRNVNPDGKAYVEGGAVYVYAKDKAVISGQGTIISPQHWYITERAKVQPPDEFAGDKFGSGIALSGSVLAIGSPGNDGAQPDSGSLYMLDASFAGLSFSAVEFPALEGTDLVATVTILRDVTKFAGEMVVEYATSDVTAKGVDSWKFDACFAMATNERGAAKCGDYEQTKGNLIIPANSNGGGFNVKIMNDLCFERYLKYIQVTISMPGSAALQGESMSARIRIDDDDFLNNIC